MNWAPVVELLGHLLMPESCPVCGKLASPLCPECLGKISAPEPPLPHCLRCGGASPCERHGRRYEARALTLHKGKARELLLTVKYGGSGVAAQKMGAALARLVGENERQSGWAIVPIPPHPRACFFPRGDSHLQWMARGLAGALGAPVRECLRWKEKRTPQKQQPDSQSRRAMPEDSFVCAGAAPEQALLLDDVSTTGTTLLRAAQCLYAAGAKEVLSLCWSVASKR